MGFLRDIFGPSKEEIWGQLSREIGASFEPDGFFKSGKVVLNHRQWQITLDAYIVSTGKSYIPVTRLRAPYVNPQGFRFKIYRKSIFSGFGKLLGMEDIEIGDPHFDEDFIIQGNSPDTVRKLFANPEIRSMITRQPEITLEVKDDEGWFNQSFPEGVDELCFEATGEIKDIARLKELFDMFATVLDELCRLGIAYEKAPGVTL